MKKLLAILVLSSIMLSVGVLAEDFSVAGVKNVDVLAGSSKTVDIKIENFGSADWFSVSSLGPNWVSTSPTAVKIGKGETKTVQLNLNPPASGTQTTYTASFIVRTGAGEKISKDFLIVLRKVERQAKISEFEMSCASCKDILRIESTIENTGLLELSGVKYSFLGGDERKEYLAGNLAPGEKKVFSTDFLVKNFKPGQYKVLADLSDEKDTLDSLEKVFSVPLLEDIAIDRQVSEGLFWKTVTVTAANRGNQIALAEVDDSVSTSALTSFFGVKPNLFREGKGVWYSKLEPGEKDTITYTEFYWPMPITFLVVAVLAVFGFFYSTSMSFKKNVMDRGDDVGISLHIKNRAGDLCRGVMIKDSVPSGFSISKSFETLKPVVRKTASGTDLVWRIGNVGKNEERVVHYKLVPSSETHKDMVLPKARLKCKRGEKDVELESNFGLVPGKEERKSLRVKFGA